MISISASANWALLGLTINSPATRPTRTSEIGASKGTSETAIAAEAASPAKESAMTLAS